MYNCVASIQTATDVAADERGFANLNKGTIPMYNCVASIQTATDVAADECGLAKKGDLFEFQRFYSNHHRVTEWLKNLNIDV